MRNVWWKTAIAVLAVLLLSAPAAVGVFRALEPTRGPWAAGLAAAGIELVYLSLALLSLRPELRPQARAVAVSAVATSIVLNVLADYAARVPQGLASWPQAVASFDPLALGLAVLESAPLAGLAFALASLLHRLAELSPGDVSLSPQKPQKTRLRWPDVSAWNAANRPASAVSATIDTVDEATTRTVPKTYACKRCGAGPFDFGELGRHARQCAKEPAVSAISAGDEYAPG